ncbi:MAG: site-2 protease family protein [Planctomycetes bacterium]|nr:site-2 protease family protein [Planctomycetota bacterium]
MSFLVPLLMYRLTGIAFGGGKPVPIDPRNFPTEHRARNFMLVALAGPGSNLFLAGVFSLVFTVCVWTGVIAAGPPIPNPYHAASSVSRVPSLLYDSDSLITTCLQLAVYLNVLLAVFNLVPLPPLDGSRFVGWLLPRPLQNGWYRLDRVGFVLVVVFFLWLHGFTLMSWVFEPVFTAYASVSDRLIALDPLGVLR